MTAIIKKSNIAGKITAPPSKSMSHRAIMCAALAGGKSVIKNVSMSQDISATLGAMRMLGATAEVDGTTITVTGIGGAPDKSACGEVFCCESGSTLRFIIPLFSLTGSAVKFTGQGRLMQRPQGVYEQIFQNRGLSFVQNYESIVIDGALTAGEYVVDGSVSSQFISGLFFALPLLDGDSTVKITPPFESRSYVNLTMQAMRDFGVSLTWKDNYTICIKGKQKYTSCDYTVEGDYSQAAFFEVLNAVTHSVKIDGLRKDSLQGDMAVMDIVKRCTQADGSLKATKIDLADCPDLGPILIVLGLFCEGETVITNAQRLRVKESDRIETMQAEIDKIGGIMHSDSGDIFVKKSVLRGADDLDGHNDHRIVMAMAVAALAAGIEVTLHGADAVKKSYPDFWRDIQMLGAEVSFIEAE